jgi:glycosyltransferase involved in cell wall biosynthesis
MRPREIRVAMLAHTCYLRDPRVRREAESLAEAGIDVHVVALAEQTVQDQPEPRAAKVKGVWVHRLPLSRKRGSLLRYFFEYFATCVLGGLTLTRLHLRSRFDVIHIHNMPDILVLAALVPRLTGARVVLDVHDPMPELFMSRDRQASNRLLVSLLRIQERIGCALADHVLSVNESMRENLESKGVPKEKIFILNNFPDQRLFPSCEPSSVWPRNRDTLVLLYCGTITEHYDLSLAVKAIAQLEGEIPVRLRLVGEGNRVDDVLRLAAALGVADRVEHVGRVPIERVRNEMQDADVGISCHRSGVFGDLYFSTKIIEYLTQGLPVLAPSTKTIGKYLPDDTLFYFEPGDEKAFADQLRRMWQNPDEVHARLNNARRFLPSLSWQAEKERFISYYQRVVGGQTAAEPQSHDLAAEPSSKSRL